MPAEYDHPLTRVLDGQSYLGEEIDELIRRIATGIGDAEVAGLIDTVEATRGATPAQAEQLWLENKLRELQENRSAVLQCDRQCDVKPP